ncbi:MAG: hypothetical protein K1Y36_03925 [Blastocatellia bacterium]|nr:hypothetical protein [Blastocatellia bacterium]
MTGTPLQRRFPLFCALLCLLLFGASIQFKPAAAFATGQTKGQTGGGAQTTAYVYRVFFNQPQDIRKITAGTWDVLESRGPNFLRVLGDQETGKELRSAGFQTEVEQAMTAPETETFSSGYRTVAEHYAHMDAIVAAHPDLAKVVDYGNSWRKDHGQANGNDLKAILITKLRPGDPVLNPNVDKPRFLLMAAIHARELSTSELAWRWMDYLVDNYGVDPDITALLDHNEIWIIPVTNPDGRVIAESGGSAPYLQRKNGNNTLGTCSDPPTSSNQYGVDLNRNADFQWGGASTSSNACNATYKGVNAASEPEEFYLEQLFTQLFKDQKGPNLTDPAVLTTTGSMITLHSYSNLVLLPWGFTECNGNPCTGNSLAPNDAGLRSFAFRMSYFNQYDTGEGSELLYAAAGTTDDWTYGVLGIPSYTFEVGPDFGNCSGFTPQYSCQDSLFWPLNRGAFLYAAKNSRQPYVSTLGPSTLTPTFTNNHVLLGSNATMQAVIDDTMYGNNGVGKPPSQAISQAEYYVDTPPWLNGAAAIPMQPADGQFNTATETATVQVSTLGLTEGRHTLFVRGRDAAGNWGATTATWLFVDRLEITAQPQSTTISSGQSTLLSVTANGTGTLSYQWYQGQSGDTTTPVGTNSKDLTTPVLNTTTSFWVRITNQAGSIASNTVTVTVASQPQFTQFYPVAAAPGKSIGIFGSGFVAGNTQVFFGGSNLIPAAQVNVINSTLLQVMVPVSGTGAANINGFITVRVSGFADVTSAAFLENAANPGLATSTFPEFVLWGDANRDGLFLTSDVALARAFNLFQAVPTARQLLALDVNPANGNGSRGDGQNNATDFALLRAVSFGQASF